MAGPGEEVVPWRTDRGEAREERHERDADDANALQAGFCEAIWMAGRRRRSGRVRGLCAQQMFSTPPKAQQPSGESGDLKDPGETEPPLTRAGKIIAGGGDDGVDFQEGDGDDEEKEKE